MSNQNRTDFNDLLGHCMAVGYVDYMFAYDLGNEYGENYVGAAAYLYEYLCDLAVDVDNSEVGLLLAPLLVHQ